MKILLAHNRYLHAGGEDTAFEAERTLLRNHGHEVIEFLEDNRRIRELGRTAVAVRSIWSSNLYTKLKLLLRREHPDVAHFHNTFPLISPSVYYACREFSIPVVQTLHNYRLICPGALLMRGRIICEDCFNKSLLWPNVLHACYRDSYAESAALTAMLIIHKILGTWKSSVDIYIALSDFSRRKFIEGGFPKNKLAVKPNFVSPDPGTGEGHGSYALYVGRLSHEKGIRTMLDAWQQLENIPLVIAGDGPFLKSASKFAEHHRQGEIRVHGHCSNDEVLRLMKGARFLIFPSLCNENSPITIAEAFACGLPVVSSDIGAVAEIVEHRRTGLNFNTGSSDALAEAVRWLWERPEQSSRMRYEARKEYEMKYTAAVNYPLLEEIYSIARRKK